MSSSIAASGDAGPSRTLPSTTVGAGSVGRGVATRWASGDAEADGAEAGVDRDRRQGAGRRPWGRCPRGDRRHPGRRGPRDLDGRDREQAGPGLAEALHPLGHAFERGVDVEHPLVDEKGLVALPPVLVVETQVHVDDLHVLGEGQLAEAREGHVEHALFLEAQAEELLALDLLGGDVARLPLALGEPAGQGQGQGQGEGERGVEDLEPDALLDEQEGRPSHEEDGERADPDRAAAASPAGAAATPRRGTGRRRAPTRGARPRWARTRSPLGRRCRGRWRRSGPREPRPQRGSRGRRGRKRCPRRARPCPGRRRRARPRAPRPGRSRSGRPSRPPPASSAAPPPSRTRGRRARPG